MTSNSPPDFGDIAWSVKSLDETPATTVRLTGRAILNAVAVKFVEQTNRIAALEAKLAKQERRLKALEGQQRQTNTSARLRAVE